MAVEWPAHLVGRIAADRWVLFIGSGVSASCLNDIGDSPPTWPDLLRSLASEIREDEARDIANRLIDEKRLLAAGDHIRYTLQAENELNTYLTTIRRAVEGPPGHAYAPSAFYNELLALDPQIVFTTNYDKLFETASRNGYSTHSFASRTLGGDLRRGDPVLVKLHGSTDSIQDIVLTRPDFARAVAEGRHVFDVLRALALTSTLLFVGYSLDDPDIQLVLEAVGRSALDPEAHYMLGSEPDTPSRVPVLRESFGVTLLTYPAGRHADAQHDLHELNTLVLGAREAAVASREP